MKIGRQISPLLMKNLVVETTYVPQIWLCLPASNILNLSATSRHEVSCQISMYISRFSHRTNLLQRCQKNSKTWWAQTINFKKCRGHVHVLLYGVIFSGEIDIVQSIFTRCVVYSFKQK